MEETLATELIHMAKMNAKRWFIVSMVELGIILALVIGILINVNIPTEEYDYEQTMEDIEQSSATQIIGGDTNGLYETASELQTQRQEEER